MNEVRQRRIEALSQARERIKAQSGTICALTEAYEEATGERITASWWWDRRWTKTMRSRQ